MPGIMSDAETTLPQGRAREGSANAKLTQCIKSPMEHIKARLHHNPEDTGVERMRAQRKHYMNLYTTAPLSKNIQCGMLSTEYYCMRKAGAPAHRQKGT